MILTFHHQNLTIGPRSNESSLRFDKASFHSRRHSDSRPFLLPMGMLVLSREAKELCLESWAFAASALFHRALISMEARYNV